MNFELKWLRPFNTQYYGQMVREGGSVWVGADLAIQRHNENDGWVCLELEKAKAFLVAVSVRMEPNVSIDSEGAPAGVDDNPRIDGGLTATVPELVAEKVELAVVAPEGIADAQTDARLAEIELAGALSAFVPAAGVTLFKCDKCPDEEFTSQRKLNAHMRAVHADAQLL